MDAGVDHAIRSGMSGLRSMVRTNALYNYVSLGLQPINSRKTPSQYQAETRQGNQADTRKKHRKTLGKHNRSQGIWLLGIRLSDWEGETGVMTLAERKTRMCCSWLKVRDHSAEAINEAIPHYLHTSETCGMNSSRPLPSQ